MAYYLYLPKCCIIIKEAYYGKDKDNHTEFLRKVVTGKVISVRFLPPFPYALQSSAYVCGQNKSGRDFRICWIWEVGHLRLAETIQSQWIGRPQRKRRPWPPTPHGLLGYRSGEISRDEAQAEYQDRQGRVGAGHREKGERHHLQTFFRLAGARYKRIRKRPRGIPSPQLVDLKTHQLQELVNLWHTGLIDLRYGDESHVCTSGYVPYGWHFEGEDVFIPSYEKHRLNIFGMISPSCIYDGFDTVDSITGGMLANYLDEFSKKIVKPTVIILDNASIHRKGQVAKMREIWKERGLYLFFLPPYSPHLNIAETLWRVLKGKWLQPYHYCSKDILHQTVREILAGIGTEYEIKFSQAA